MNVYLTVFSPNLVWAFLSSILLAFLAHLALVVSSSEGGCSGKITLRRALSSLAFFPKQFLLLNCGEFATEEQTRRLSFKMFFMCSR